MRRKGRSLAGAAIVLLGGGLVLIACILVTVMVRPRRERASTDSQSAQPSTELERVEYAREKPAVYPLAGAHVDVVASPGISDQTKACTGERPRRHPALPPEVNGTDIVNLQREVFLREPRDLSWSDRATTQVAAALAGHLPEGASLGKVECRMTMCSVELQYRDVGSYDEFVRSTIAGNSDLWAAPISAIITSQDEHQVRAQLFVAREGHVLPQPDSIPSH